MADSNPPEPATLSKNALKKQLKAQKREEERRRKEEEEKMAAKPISHPHKPYLADHKDTDPNQYYENRVKFLDELKAAGINPYPHKFDVTMTIAEFIGKYGGLNNGEYLEDVLVLLAGRIMSKRPSSSKLLFYNLHGGGAKVQVVADARTSELEEAEFSKFHFSVKRFDIVGVTGFPGKTKIGELSVFPKSFCCIITLSPCNANTKGWPFREH